MVKMLCIPLPCRRQAFLSADSSANGRRDCGGRVSFELLWGRGGKKGKLEKNLRFAMGMGQRWEIFLRFGRKGGCYWVIRELNVPLPYLEHKL